MQLIAEKKKAIIQWQPSVANRISSRRRDDTVDPANKRGLLITSIQPVSIGNLKLSTKKLECQPPPNGLVSGQVADDDFEIDSMMPELLASLVRSLK